MSTDPDLDYFKKKMRGALGMGERKCLYAYDIHPNVLGSMIPVKTPVFIGADGGVKKCVCEDIGDWKEENFDEPLCVDNLPLIRRCVKYAQELGWVYLFGISDIDGRMKIRGCKEE